jgi:hypothetical protein
MQYMQTHGVFTPDLRRLKNDKICTSVVDPSVCAPCTAVMDVMDDDVSSPRIATGRNSTVV